MYIVYYILHIFAFYYKETYEKSLASLDSWKLKFLINKKTHLNVIVSLDFQAKWSYKWDIIFGAGLNVDFFQHTRISNHLISIYDINQRFLESYTPNTRHVKSVDIIPPINFVIFVLAIFDGSDIQSGPVGEHQAIRG